MDVYASIDDLSYINLNRHRCVTYERSEQSYVEMYTIFILNGKI